MIMKSQTPKLDLIALLPPRNLIVKGLISRKTVAQLLGPEFTAAMVRTNEEKLGIHAARITINKRLIRYRARMLLRILREGGYIE